MTPNFETDALQEKDVESLFAGKPSSEDSPDNVYIFPASLEQSRYWILDQLDGASTASNMAIAFRLQSAPGHPLNDVVVEQCIRDLVLRHEALRTTFRVVDGVLSQVISEEPAYDFSVADVSTLPPAERPAAAEALIAEHSRAQVDLANGPVFHVRLIHLSSEDHFLAFTIHHIACDGWSNGILVRDFTALYDAHAAGRSPDLPALPFQFADFTVWQQNWLESPAAAAALAFWKDHIRRDMPAVDLPADYPRPAQKSFPGHIESRLISAGLTARLRAYCRTANATMHQVMLAAFEAFITRITGQDQFLLGSTIANRTQPGMENVLGRFANPQVVLADVQGDPTYRELVRRVADWSALSYAHQDLPFSRLMEEFQLDQAGATSQFLQVYFVYQKAFMQPQQAGTLKVTPRPSVSGGVNFDLLVSIVERAEGPRLQMEYNTVLFSPVRVQRLLDQYLRLVEAVMLQDDLPVSALPLLSPGEQSAFDQAATGDILERSTRKAIAHRSIPEHLDHLGGSRAASDALIVGGNRITWRELHLRSLALAHAFTAVGVESGQTVALRLESTVESSLAVLALLRLGAVLVPVPEAAAPAEWLRVRDELIPAHLFSGHDFAQTIPFLTPLPGIEAASSVLPSPIPYPQPGCTAWLALGAAIDGSYTTSPVSHTRTLTNMTSAAQALSLGATDIVGVFPAATSVDCFTDRMIPWLTGAAILFPGEIAAPELQSLLDREQVTFAIAQPHRFTRLLEQGWPGDRRLNAVCRGSRISPATRKRLLARLPRVWSLISAAATAGPFTVSRLYPVGTTELHPWPAKPLPGHCFRLLDAAGSPVPAGTNGELWSGTTATSVDKALLESQFESQVESQGEAPDLAENSLLAPTGFLARFSPPSESGNSGFEIIEAADRRVRLHGYRLTFGDLEDRLLEHPSVSIAEAAVYFSEDGTERLVAYVAGWDSPSSPGKPSPDHLRTFLKANAPAHLSSADIVPVTSIPRHLDGTPDFTLLPSPAHQQTGSVPASEYVPPRDELETRLVRIWEEVLGISGIGIRSSFFSLGGYSLMIVRLFARVNKALGTSLPITTIFNAPTVEQLADILRGRALYSSIVPVQPRGSRPPFFMIHSYLLYGGLPSVLGEDQPFYGLRELDSDRQMDLETRVASYVREIRSVQPEGPYHIGGWCAAGPLAVETARQLNAAGQSVAVVILFDSWRPGYAQEVASEHSGSPVMNRSSVLRRKYLFHRNKLRALSTSGKFNYFWSAFAHKIHMTSQRLYLRNWAFTQRLFGRLGMPLPAFMHNISLTTLNAVREYKGQPFDGPLVLIRATDAVYVHGADPSCGWDSLTTAGVQVLWAPGSHETMFIQPNLDVVGKMVTASLAHPSRASSDQASMTIPASAPAKSPELA